MLLRGLGGADRRMRGCGADILRSGAVVAQLAAVVSLGAAEGWRRRSAREHSSLLRLLRQAGAAKAEGGQLYCSSSWAARSRLTPLSCGGEGREMGGGSRWQMRARSMAEALAESLQEASGQRRMLDDMHTALSTATRAPQAPQLTTAASMPTSQQRASAGLPGDRSSLEHATMRQGGQPQARSRERM